MKSKTPAILRTAATVLATTFIALAAHAATPTPAGCNANEAQNDPAACKRESGAARQEAKKGNLTAPGAAAGQNTADRCRALSGGEKTDCLSRVSGGGTSTTTTSGSVEGGGQIRETTTVIPAKP